MRSEETAEGLEAVARNTVKLRSAAGLSQEELAAKAGISRVSLGKLERGDVEPRSDTLVRVARALGVPLRDLVVPPEPLERVRFRARKQVNGREQVLAEVASWLRRYSALEELLDQGSRFPIEDLSRAGEEAPSVLAARAREWFEIGAEPVRDVCGLLEDGGIKVLLLPRATDAFFGLSVGAADGGPAVVVNTWERISVERWIFTAAHELGHLLLHAESFHRATREESPAEEKEADEFAGYFLMPPETFAKEWNGTSGRLLIDRVLKVKRIFRVSYKTVLRRLNDTGLAGPEIWKLFQVQHLRRFRRALRKADEPNPLVSFRRSEEPDGLSESDFREDRLSRLVRRALEEEKISLGRAAEILGVSLGQMRERVRGWAP